MTVLMLGIGSSSCSTLRYLTQAGRGQLALIQRAKPIEQVLKDEKVSPRIKKLLAEIPRIKSYAEGFGIKPTQNYREYVQLDRAAAVWVVSACEPLSFTSKQWRFPLVGSFPFLGWFDEASAHEFGGELKAQGWDVDVRGASAYSTLGWFRDSVLSTMIREGQEARGDLVNVVIHESVHATLYIGGQSHFNESLADFVADELTIPYLRANQGETDAMAYLEAVERSEAQRKKLHEAYDRLLAIYQSSRSREEKLAEKERVFVSLKEQLKIKRELSNASLVQFRTYDVGKAEFRSLLRRCSGDWARFWAALGNLKEASFGGEEQESIGPVLDRLSCA